MRTAGLPCLALATQPVLQPALCLSTLWWGTPEGPGGGLNLQVNGHVVASSGALLPWELGLPDEENLDVGDGNKDARRASH